MTGRSSVLRYGPADMPEGRQSMPVASLSPSLSETDYIVKICGNFLRCAWGETHCTAVKEANNATVIKADLRIIGNTSYKYSTGEFARSFPDAFLLNRIVGNGAKTALLFHVAGLEANVVALLLAADGLYVAHTVAHTVLPDCVKKVSIIKESLIPTLFKYREYIDGLYDDHQSGTEAEKRKHKGLWRATSDTASPEEAALPLSTWVRGG
ncbi:hypothetical protein BJV82DRAFT_672488 [Fennellomyces sp. T-0311]|nr:hypothetical protein BJV82DRAFT_672488 [Fennellomyces sp. T-0311]